jgi:hypothetical protein
MLIWCNALLVGHVLGVKKLVKPGTFAHGDLSEKVVSILKYQALEK